MDSKGKDKEFNASDRKNNRRDLYRELSRVCSRFERKELHPSDFFHELGLLRRKYSERCHKEEEL